ncbi:hypothetical protein [Flavobacterium chungbukense]|nr:hypothetical protein [Flavobacterium chungbukense]MCC4920925.1 hypothetical protein [Flavobacterium chungbukense]
MNKKVTFTIVNIVFWVIFILLGFYFKSAKSKYLRTDIYAFKEDSWKFLIIISLLLLLIIAFYFFYFLKKKIRIGNLLVIILYAFMIPYFLKTYIDNFLLYINTKFAHEVAVVEYNIIENEKNKVYELYDGKNFIDEKEELNKINNHIINEKYNSVYKYKNKDVIKVEFTNGFLNVKYLE